MAKAPHPSSRSEDPIQIDGKILQSSMPSRSNIKTVKEEATVGKLPRSNKEPKFTTSKRDCGKKAKVSLSSTTQHLPDEILESGVLPCIPAKALMRMKSVCKRWHSILSDPNPLFIQLQAKQTSSGIISSPVRSRDWILLAEDQRSMGIHKIKYPLMNQIAASCKGLLCVENGSSILIGNPFFINTPSWVQIPPPGKLLPPGELPYPGFNFGHLWGPYHYPVFGLAVDVEGTGIDYKLVLINTASTDIVVDSVFHIFSPVSKQWSAAKGRPVWPRMSILFNAGVLPNPREIFDGPAVYVDGSLYRKLAVGDALCFNIKEELCSLLQLPPTAGGNPEHGQIGECGGKLSYAAISGNRLKMWLSNDSKWSITLSINISSPLGSKLKSPAPSQHKMKLRGQRFIETDSHLQKTAVMMPFEGGVYLSFYFDGFIHCYNTLTMEFRKLTEGGENDVWFPYKNSLVLPPGVGEEKIQITRIVHKC